MKRIISILLTAIMLVSLFSVSAFAEEKKEEQENEPTEEAYTSEEVIYGVLDAEGNINKVLPVVVLDAAKDCSAEYYGEFKDVKNLTNTDEISYENGRVKLELPKGRFYFQAETERAELPWEIEIGYKLDGKKISPEKLGGKSGKLEIIISVEENKKGDKSFFDAYLMQISATLSSEKCKNIKAEGATLANAGANKMINFMSMPGSESEFIISADVSDFSMGGMSIAAVPLSMADMLGSMGGIAEGIDEFEGSMDQLSSGVSQLNSGAYQLAEGINEFSIGLLTLSANSAPIREAAGTMLEGLKAVDSALSAMGDGNLDLSQMDLSILPQMLRTLAASLNASADKINAEQDNISLAVSNMNSAFEQDTSAISDPAAIEYINNLYATWMQQAAILNTAIVNLEVVEQELGGYADSLNQIADAIDAIIANSGGSGGNIGDYIGQFKELVAGFEMLCDGIIQYTQGVDMLAEGSVPLADGAAQLAGGTSQLNSGTSQIPGKMDEMMEEMGGEDFETHSFLSDKNRNVSSVQFVFSTEGIDAPAEDTPEEDEAEPLSGAALFFSKFKALFTKEEN